MLLTVFSAAVLLSAALLFSVQPMVAKMVLPLYGGSPAVWTTCMLFFQAALLAGYLYAHLLCGRLTLAKQILVHLAVLGAGAIALPVGVPQGWSPGMVQHPVASLLVLLAAVVGLPFFAASATAPLLQRWFSATDHPSAHDPYFLYAVSNIGSMAALLGYPLVCEPLLRLREQGWWWSCGYGMLWVAIAASGGLAWRRDPRRGQRVGATADRGQRESAARGKRQRAAHEAAVASRWGQRLRWAALALVPCSWMLGVTAHITTDITPFPLLWVIPLALYLLSFIVAFSRRPWLPHVWTLRLLPLAMILLVASLMMGERWRTLGIHLLAFFIGALACHGELARQRPATDRLTEFYLWLSFGGVLGGVFNAVIAPLVFPVYLELPLAMAAACALCPAGVLFEDRRRELVAVGIILVAAVAVVHQFEVVTSPVLVLVVGMGLAGLLLAQLLRRPLWFGLVAGAVLAWDQFDVKAPYEVLYRARSFFGTHVVVQDQPVDSSQPRPLFRRLLHGTTQHGLQAIDPPSRCQPMGYFHRRGPLGDVLSSYVPRGRTQRIAVIGLGTGTMACYAAEGRHFTFYEIDPTVRRIAESPQYFTYLSDCSRGRYSIVIGDGRLMLQRADRRYDMVILDAFSSDAIPTHLITRQALEIYRQRLRDDGLLVFHVSNRHLDLVTVLADLAPELRMAGMVRRDVYLDPQHDVPGYFPSTWVVLARDAARLGPLEKRSGWQWLPVRSGRRAWSDDFFDILSILRWNPAQVARGTQ